jgi:glycerol-3-phosphate dehydrogenase subunit C
MEDSCLLFPELYRQYDLKREKGKSIGVEDLHRILDLCTLCGLCPCPNIRADLIRSKTDRVSAKGMPIHIRLLEDVQRAGRLGGKLPGVINTLQSFAPVDRLAKKIAGIHPQRRLPRLPRENFFAWAHRKGLDRNEHRSHGIAYFAGCTAGYLFPEVARAAVAVLRHNGHSVYVPPQQCCGMPTLLEGDEKTTLNRSRFNLKALLTAHHDGYKLVCSCPTCGFLMKVLLSEGACYANAYQKSVNAGENEIKFLDRQGKKEGFIRLKKSIYDNLLRDDGYFASFDPLDRVALSASMLDMGELLSRLHDRNKLNTCFGKQPFRLVYYAPCHQREQAVGTPYLDIMRKIPGLSIEPIGSSMDCCGMGGSLGFKKEFHNKSLELGLPLIKKIQDADPQGIVTDCLSCRLQFQHTMSYPVHHPLEILKQAYESFEQV